MKISFIKSSLEKHSINSSPIRKLQQHSEFDTNKYLSANRDYSQPKVKNLGRINKYLKASIWNNPDDKSGIIKMGELMIICEDYKVIEIV